MTAFYIIRINFQLRFGVDTDNDQIPDYFDSISNIITEEQKDLSSVRFLNNILAVNISLLLVSGSSDEGDVEQVATEPQTISYADWNNITMPDRRLRKVFETTVTLRNQIN